MKLKIFQVDYVWEPSGLEHLIILAESEEEALKLAKEYSEQYSIEKVIEKSFRKGVISKAYYCC